MPSKKHLNESQLNAKVLVQLQKKYSNVHSLSVLLLFRPKTWEIVTFRWNRVVLQMTFDMAIHSVMHKHN